MVSTTIFSSLNISCSHNYPLFCQCNTLVLEELLPFLAGVLPAGAVLLLDVRQVVVLDLRVRKFKGIGPKTNKKLKKEVTDVF